MDCACQLDSPVNGQLRTHKRLYCGMTEKSKPSLLLHLDCKNSIFFSFVILSTRRHVGRIVYPVRRPFACIIVTGQGKGTGLAGHFDTLTLDTLTADSLTSWDNSSILFSEWAN